MFGTWRPLEADPRGQPDTAREVTLRYAFMYVQVPDITFVIKIKVLTQTNLNLDIHEGTPKWNLPICTLPAFRISLQRPSGVFDIIFEILTITNLYLDVHEGISTRYLLICTWLASRISLQRPPGIKHYC